MFRGGCYLKLKYDERYHACITMKPWMKNWSCEQDKRGFLHTSIPLTFSCEHIYTLYVCDYFISSASCQAIGIFETYFGAYSTKIIASKIYSILRHSFGWRRRTLVPENLVIGQEHEQPMPLHWSLHVCPLSIVLCQRGNACEPYKSVHAVNSH